MDRTLLSAVDSGRRSDRAAEGFVGVCTGPAYATLVHATSQVFLSSPDLVQKYDRVGSARTRTNLALAPGRLHHVPERASPAERVGGIA